MKIISLFKISPTISLCLALFAFAPFCLRANTALAVVSISASRQNTSEPTPTSRIAPGEFVLHRDGLTDRSLTVFLTYEGTAAVDADYTPLPRSVTFDQGAADLSLFVEPKQDNLVEGDETVVARIIPPLTAIVPSYTIDPSAAFATVLIHDANTKPAPVATATITSPVEASELPAGVDIQVTAVAVDPNGYMPRLEFYLDGALLDISQIEFFRAPDAGTPVTHTVLWKNPAPGEHVLTAVGVDSFSNKVSSTPVHVVVVGQAPSSSATLLITSPTEGMELPAGVDVEVTAVAVDPNGYIPRAEFYLDGALLGVSQIEFFRAPDPGTPVAHSVLWKNPARGKHVLTALSVDSLGNKISSPPVHVVITGQAPPSAVSLKITSPTEGDKFSAGGDVPITAVATDPNGYISRVEFYANEDLIGVSDLKFFRAPDPGTPITHSVIWSNVRAGVFALTARAVDSLGNRVTSAALNISVVETGEEMPNAKLIIVSPKDGSVFDPGQRMPIRVEFSNEETNFEHLDLLADGQLLTTTKVSPLTFVWIDAPAGPHTLVVRGFSAGGAIIESDTVRSLVQKTLVVQIGDRPQITTIQHSSDDSLQLKFEGSAEHAYILESSSDLKIWSEENSIFLPNGQLNYSPKPNDAKQAYYRLRAR